MIDYFVRPLEGVSTELTHAELVRWRGQAATRFRARPAAVVRGPLGAGRLDLWADYEQFRHLTERPKKFTLTSPYMLARTLADEHYHDLSALTMALAAVLGEQLSALDADIVQVDEANLPGNPVDGPLAARAINQVLGSVRGTRAVHLCFGNYGGQTIQRGRYDALLPFLNALEADHLVLEMARRPADELDVLRDVDPRIGLGIGVIDIKDNEIESADEVARRIDHAAQRLGASRLHFVHPDCGFWMLPRSVADAKLEALVRGRNLALKGSG
jgi:5-methyltetrahydropteroyltriglutamate--homocysteine methyltransferase